MEVMKQIVSCSLYRVERLDDRFHVGQLGDGQVCMYEARCRQREAMVATISSVLTPKRHAHVTVGDQRETQCFATADDCVYHLAIVGFIGK